MQRIAIIDIGSNSARLVVSRIYKNGSYNMIFSQKDTLRLSQHLDGRGMLSPEGCHLALRTMENFAYLCHLYQVDHIVAVATAAIRAAKNGTELTDLIAKRTGIQLHIIAGTTEAYLSYLGVINTLPQESGILFDLGGGSTELVLFQNRQIVDSVSIPLGAVNTTAMWGTRETMPPTTVTDVNLFVTNQLVRHAWLQGHNLPLIGVGGTARTVGKMIQKSSHYPISKIHNYSFSASAFQALYKTLISSTAAKRRKMPGLNSERVDIILAGVSIIRCLFEVTGSRQMVVSGCGVREGLFYDYYSKANHVPLIAPDILAASTENMLKLYGTDAAHCRHVAELALSMFDGWKPLHKLPRAARCLLQTAALLHDIGITINYYSHARHSAYMILNAKLFGLTHVQQLMVSAIAGWHNGVSKGYFKTADYRELLTAKHWDVIGKCALMLAIAEALDYSETGRITAVHAALEKGRATLRLSTQTQAEIEQHQVQQLASWFSKTLGVPLRMQLEQAGDGK